MTLRTSYKTTVGVLSVRRGSVRAEARGLVPFDALRTSAALIMSLLLLSPAAPNARGEDPPNNTPVPLRTSRERKASGALSVYTNWRTYTTREGLPHDGIRALRPFGDRIWVGTENGLARYSRGSWKTWTRASGALPARTVSAIDVDPRTRDVWIGTWGDGLLRYTAGRFDQFEQMNSGLAGNLIFDVAVAGDRVWAATNGGVSSYNPREDAWELYHARRADAPETVVIDFACDGIDLYAGLWRGGGMRFDRDGNRWLPLPVSMATQGPDRLSSLRHDLDTAWAVTCGDGILWYATQAALLRRDAAGKWERRGIEPSTRRDGSVYCVASPGGSQVWLGTEEGVRILAGWSNNTWIDYRGDTNESGGVVIASRNGRTLEGRRVPSIPPATRVRCIAFDGGGVWIGTVNGLVRGTEAMRWEELPPVDPGDVHPGTPLRLSANMFQDRPEPRASARAEQRTIGLETTTKPRLPSPPVRTADPQELPSVSIAMYGPRNRTISIPGQWEKPRSRTNRVDPLAVQLALQQANAQGGFRGAKPFNLFMRKPGYAGYAWQTPEDDFVVYAANESVMGIVAALTPNDRIADAVALRTEIPVVNMGGNKMPGFANPWVFQCWGDQPRQNRLLIDYLFDELNFTRLAALCTPGEAAGKHVDWWRHHAGNRGQPLIGEVWSESSEEGIARAVDKLLDMRPDAVLTWCDADTAAAIVRRMREKGMSQPLVGGPELLNGRFVELVGADPGLVIALKGSVSTVAADELSVFARRYMERNVIGKVKTPPGLGAFRAYEATDHLLTALNRTAAADREALRRTLESMSRSAMGELHYERLHRPTAVTLAHLESGRWIFRTIKPRADKLSSTMTTAD